MENGAVGVGEWRWEGVRARARAVVHGGGVAPEPWVSLQMKQELAAAEQSGVADVRKDASSVEKVETVAAEPMPSSSAREHLRHATAGEGRREAGGREVVRAALGCDGARAGGGNGALACAWRRRHQE